MKSLFMKLAVIFFLIIPEAITAQNIFETAHEGNLSEVKRLVEADKNCVNKTDIRNRTPLYYAIIGKNEQVVSYLIDHGADVNLVLKHSGSLLDLALQINEKQIAGLLAAKGAKTTEVTYTVKKLAENISQFSFTSGMLNNILISDGSDGLLIFDSGYSKPAAEIFKKYLDNNYKNKVKFIFNTHIHGDHVAGNNIFGLENKIIFSSFLKNNYGLLGTVKVTTPLKGRTGRSFKLYFTKTLNGEEIRMIPYPGVHSDDDLIFHFTGSKVVFLGDLLLSQCFPAVQSPAAYSKFLEEVIDIFPEDITFISGHGKSITYQELEEYSSLLKKTASLIKDNMEKGKDLETMLKEDILKEYRNEYSFLDFLGPDTWIRVVYTELKKNIGPK